LRQAGVDERLVHDCGQLLEKCAAADFAPGLVTEPAAELSASAEHLIGRMIKQTSGGVCCP
jgi:hypothetical protein